MPPMINNGKAMYISPPMLTQTPLGAQLHSTKIELPEGSISATMEDSIPAKRSFFKKFLDYFNDANKEKKNKKFDFS